MRRRQGHRSPRTLETISVERSGFFALVQTTGRCRPRCSKHLSTGGPSKWQRPRRSRATWTSCSSGTPGATRARSPPTFPELASADPDLFGICLATVDGALYEAGDTRAPFTIQSMSKPLTYGLALELARRGGGAKPRRRRAQRRPVQRDQPPGRNRDAGEPDDQRGGDHLRRARVRGKRRADGAPPRDVLDLRRPAARDRRGRVPLRGGHRPQKPRDRASSARPRGARLRPGGRARPLLPPVLGQRRLPRSRPRSPRRSRTGASIRSPGCARCARTSSAASSA